MQPCSPRFPTGSVRRSPRLSLTGGLHAARALLDAGGTVLCVREDVGRHNAVDKVVGWAYGERLLPLPELRSSASAAAFRSSSCRRLPAPGAPVLIGVGAPSSLAVELATAQQITLCGFARNGRMNVYSARERLLPPAG